MAIIECSLTATACTVMCFIVVNSVKPVYLSLCRTNRLSWNGLTCRVIPPAAANPQHAAAADKWDRQTDIVPFHRPRGVHSIDRWKQDAFWKKLGSNFFW